ncbi:nucleoside triphosphate pyrophosphohydrolase [Vibrio agarivorans]|uniref:nucleoside triphosphate pyrophosphohydrolase n=1 Tax=Vibrio agarivorans TaxID=153622 RepID=UPI0022319734|nr:nucleoside triphosphate pyrophosphohydrolase [Vibrio agarivorans]MDN3660362.1 nucleoside triphosphate pyrophosphohydrolase [Vibrio agarivorans]
MAKIVRDNIPQIIRESGKTPRIKTLEDTELVDALDAKLVEELQEYQSETDTAKAVEELADMYEVIIALAKVKGYALEDFLAIAERKRNANGGFDDGVYWMGNE